MKGGLEFGAIVGLDQVDLERQLLEDIVEESDGGLLVQAVEDLENAEAQVSRNSVSFRRAPIANFLSSAERRCTNMASTILTIWPRAQVSNINDGTHACGSWVCGPLALQP